MTVKVQMVNGGSDSVDFVNAAGTTLAQVKGYDDTSSNGHLELYTTASGTSTEQMRITSAGNVGIGTSSPVVKLDVVGSSARTRWNLSNAYSYQVVTNPSDSAYLDSQVDALSHIWKTSSTERMRIDSSGNLLVGTTSNPTSYGNAKLMINAGTSDSVNILGGSAANCINLVKPSGFTNSSMISFNNSSSTVGSITISASATAYNTSSDYRLKENIQPMTGALAKVAALKPCTYTWKVDGSDGEGFIAHELAEVVPDCVHGEKDAVDENGNPVYQGIDTSFLVATLTAAIKEQQAIIQTLTERITALENKQ